MGKYTIFHSSQKNNRELKTLRSVQCHQRDNTTSGIGDPVRISNQ